VAENGGTLLLVGLSKLDLHAVNAVYTVNEQDQDKDERDLHPILEFCYQRTLADEGKHLSADCEWERDDEEHEQCHLCYEQEEDEAVVECHLDGLIRFGLWEEVSGRIVSRFKEAVDCGSQLWPEV